MLLDGYVGKVDEHVVQLAGARRVLHCAEAAEPKLVPGSEPTPGHRRGEGEYAAHSTEDWL